MHLEYTRQVPDFSARVVIDYVRTGQAVRTGHGPSPRTWKLSEDGRDASSSQFGALLSGAER